MSAHLIPDWAMTQKLEQTIVPGVLRDGRGELFMVVDHDEDGNPVWKALDNDQAHRVWETELTPYDCQVDYFDRGDSL